MKGRAAPLDQHWEEDAQDQLHLTHPACKGKVKGGDLGRKFWAGREETKNNSRGYDRRWISTRGEVGVVHEDGVRLGLGVQSLSYLVVV